MIRDHEYHVHEMDCDMACLKLELVQLQKLKEGFKHFITERWLPLIQYIHSPSNTQCSCRTDARNRANSTSSYHTPPCENYAVVTLFFLKFPYLLQDLLS